MEFDVQHGGETDRTGLGLDESRDWKYYPSFFSCYLIARLVKMSTFIFFSPLTLSPRVHLKSPTDAALLQCVWRRSPLLSTGRSIAVTRMEGAVASNGISDLWTPELQPEVLVRKGGWGSTSFHSWSLFRKFTINADSMEEPSRPQNSDFLVSKQKRRDLAFRGKWWSLFSYLSQKKCTIFPSQ